MRIEHPAVKTNILKLVGTYELDLSISPELNFPLRFELFQDTEKSRWFRVHVWEQEYFDLEPKFRVKRKGMAVRYKTTEKLMLNRPEQLTGDYNYFKATNVSDALTRVIEDLKGRLAHWSLNKAK